MRLLFSLLLLLNTPFNVKTINLLNIKFNYVKCLNKIIPSLTPVSLGSGSIIEPKYMTQFGTPIMAGSLNNQGEWEDPSFNHSLKEINSFELFSIVH